MAELWPCPISGQMIDEGTYDSDARLATEHLYEKNTRHVAWIGPRKYEEIVIEEPTRHALPHYKAKHTGKVYPQWLLIPADKWNNVLREAHGEQAYDYVQAAKEPAVKTSKAKAG